ncbi:HAMP domain-containing histidine kinase [Blastococcus sp. MG754426]|uniref:HAMP domain-containing sensor histidine kinase n=1 Tax=unclassified Blastococcus TaxID=2619396 RepID=UPI001EF15E35|nr:MULTISPECIES: HAMP domain-containing sensor histidine kinase [unclassified Blastococcus]MCF6507412.1 HAMP domain-containing histidine kinase [Blastococcus sp. MG754426]MCF6512040.1 HAMP domain-containing histidine kinase [Blastococcus sp. MG754427]
MTAPAGGAAAPAAGSPPVRRPPYRLATLRARATAAFAAVTLLLSTVLAVAVWVAVSQFLLVQRERVTLVQTSDNAAQVQRSLATEGLDVAQVLAQLPRETGSTSLLVDDGAWTTTSLLVGRDDLPEELREQAVAGTPVRQRIELDGETVMAVAVPLAELGSAYIEVFPLGELDRTYRVLATVLAVAVLGSVPLAVVVGWWLTGPTLRPLDRISAAAAAVAGGALDTRIDPRGDPSLAPIAASFNQTAEALEQRVRSDARFAADVSHELRSPLTTMMGALDLVEATADPGDAEQAEALGLLRSEVERFERLVADLLEISRADAGSADVALEPVQLSAFTREVAARHRLDGATAALLTVHPDAEGVPVCADKRRLERVLGNLLDNADKHGGGVTGIAVTRAGDRALVTVDDAGPGVAAAERDRVFERFARGAGSVRTSTEGSGLGLALVARHVRLMGGTVHVEDGPDGGARFVVSLPVEAGP